MWNLANRRSLVAFVSMAIMALAGGPVLAQRAPITTTTTTTINPNLALNQAAFNLALLNRAMVANAVVNRALTPAPTFGTLNAYSPAVYGGGGLYNTMAYDPYSGSSYNPYYPYYDPYGGALRGVADILGAQGKFQVSMAQSSVIGEQFRQARIDTRRRLFDEYQYERANTPTTQMLREMDQKEMLRRSINNAPTTEILSGDAMNIILDHLMKAQANNIKATSVPLEADTLAKINVRPLGRNGNVSLLKNGGILKWPLPLQVSEYEKERKQVDELIVKAVHQADFQTVDRGTLKDIVDNMKKLQERVSSHVNDMGTGKYLEAKRYLNAVDEAVRALGQDDITNYFNHKYEARGNTVAELVKYMKDKGLRFAPSIGSEEGAYKAVHQALVSYDNSLNQQVARE